MCGSAMNRLLSAALIAVAAPSAQAGDPAVRQACLEVTGAINPVGDDHTCALWAKGKYFHQEDEYENGKPVWHREQSEVLHWGVVGGEDIRLVYKPGLGHDRVGWYLDRSETKGGGGYLCEQAHPERLDSPLDCKMFLFDFGSIGANPNINPSTHRCAIRRCPSGHQEL